MFGLKRAWALSLYTAEADFNPRNHNRDDSSTQALTRTAPVAVVHPQVSFWTVPRLRYQHSSPQTMQCVSLNHNFPTWTRLFFFSCLLFIHFGIWGGGRGQRIIRKRRRRWEKPQILGCWLLAVWAELFGVIEGFLLL